MPNPTPTDEQLMSWVEQVTMFLARDGVSPIAGRILGWLMICDPSEQSAAQIAAVIGASRASLTMNLQVLMSMGFVRRRTRAGERTAYYSIEDSAWENVVRRQIASLAAFSDIAAAGMEMVGSESDRAARLREAYRTFAWMTQIFADAPPLSAARPASASDHSLDSDTRPDR